MNPWHLHAENVRAFVLETLDEHDGNEWWRKDVRAAYAAAAAFLRAAEPDYPDDCPAVQVEFWSGLKRDCEIVDVEFADGRTIAWVLAGDGEWPIEWCELSALTPLTKSAADLLAALGGGDDE